MAGGQDAMTAANDNEIDEFELLLSALREALN
jgi:hypothetical protein